MSIQVGPERGSVDGVEHMSAVDSRGTDGAEVGPAGPAAQACLLLVSPEIIESLHPGEEVMRAEGACAGPAAHATRPAAATRQHRGVECTETKERAAPCGRIFGPGLRVPPPPPADGRLGAAGTGLLPPAHVPQGGEQGRVQTHGRLCGQIEAALEYQLRNTAVGRGDQYDPETRVHRGRNQLPPHPPPVRLHLGLVRRRFRARRGMPNLGAGPWAARAGVGGRWRGRRGARHPRERKAAACPPSTKRQSGPAAARAHSSRQSGPTAGRLRTGSSGGAALLMPVVGSGRSRRRRRRRARWGVGHGGEEEWKAMGHPSWRSV